MTIEFVMEFRCTLKFAERDNFVVETSKGNITFESFNSLPKDVKDFIKNSERETITTATGIITKYKQK